MYLKLVFITLCLWVGGSSSYLVFPSEAGSDAWGIFGAIAVPLELPHRNVFISYNFEANYNLPWHAKDLIPGILEKNGLFEGWEDDLFQKPEGRAHASSDNSTIDDSDEEIESTTYASESDSSDRKRQIKIREVKENPRKYTHPSLINRKSFYSLLHEKFKYAGYLGKPCVLKLICETNHHDFAEHNGVLGQLFHVLFTPTSSEDEGLTIDYYKAERNGRLSSCELYDEICPHSIIDLISSPVMELFNKV